MKNISFDNPYLLLLAIPAVALLIVSFIISRNKDNKTLGWSISLVLHLVIVGLVSLAIAGLMSMSVLTRTTVYVVADVSYSSDRNLDEVDGYIREVKDSLPENSRLGVVCFAKDWVVLTPAGRALRSVSEARVDKSATDIAGALSYTEGLFGDDTLKRIVLITDGNDTVNKEAGALASTVQRLTENGIKIDTVFLNNTLKEGESEVQLSGVEHSSSAYIGQKNEAKLLVQSSEDTSIMLELYAKSEDASDEEYERIDYTVVTAESGLTTVTLKLPTDAEGSFEYLAKITSESDISDFNNSITFRQSVVGRTRILLITGDSADRSVIELAYGGDADIDSYVVGASGSAVPFRLEELVCYDEIVISNVDVRDIRNANAFVDNLDTAVSQYGKSLIALGDLRLQNDEDSAVLDKFAELLPVSYGNASRDGKLYTIVLDVSHSMFMAYKFTIAREAAIKLLSLLNDEDYVCLVTFSGDVKVKAPAKVKDCRQELVGYIDGLTTDHGTDLVVGLEEALKAVSTLRLAENQVMIVSDGFSFESDRTSREVAEELYASGTPVSAINTYVSSDGEEGRERLRGVVNAGEGGRYYEISRVEDVENVVFGSVANEVTEAIIERESTVNIDRYKDGIVAGLTSVPNVSTYIQSIKKYDATVPLTVNYVKPSGYVEKVPLYAYRMHGNGAVASFTGSLSGDWMGLWDAQTKKAFIENMFSSCTPSGRVDYPYTMKLERDAFDAYVEVVPSVLNPNARTTVKITYPNGRTVTKELAFDSQKYFYTFSTADAGMYEVSFTYAYDDKEFSSRLSFDIPYLPEYNAFANFDKSVVYDFMRGNGGITEGEIPSLELDMDEVSTYKVSYTIPLLIAACALFVVDIAVRKIRINRKRRVARLNKS